MKPTNNMSSSMTQWLGVALIIALGVVNVLLFRQNLLLRKQLRAGKSVQTFRGGEQVEPINGIDLQGQPYAINFTKSGRQHLLLFFSPSCPYCLQQAPAWRDLLDKVDTNRFDVVGVVSDKNERLAVAKHVDELGYFRTKIPLPIVFLKDDALARLKLLATPTTLLVSDAGVVEHEWVGKWNETSSDEVTAAVK